MSQDSIPNLLQPRGAFARLHDWLTGPRPVAAPAPKLQPRPVKPRNIGRGFVDPRQGGKTRIVVTVEPELLARVHARAQQQEISLAAAVRQLIDLGLGNMAGGYDSPVERKRRLRLKQSEQCLAANAAANRPSGEHAPPPPRHPDDPAGP